MNRLQQFKYFISAHFESPHFISCVPLRMANGQIYLVLGFSAAAGLKAASLIEKETLKKRIHLGG
jgi:hypothetical protein